MKSKGNKKDNSRNEETTKLTDEQKQKLASIDLKRSMKLIKTTSQSISS
jgi:hypothetical protein